ncbi:tape measure protein [Gordonia phage Keelan]|nr:tape measure protein [Gordonia phage Keelan]
MAIELAQAYVSLHIESKDVPKEVGNALGGNATQREANKAGEKSGSRFASGMGKVLMTAGAAAGAAGGAAIGGALVSGFSRLSKIEEAKSKLTGLGNTSLATSDAMDSALQAVQGTAYGLDDAATIAASAMAAGVKPGKELTNYLKLTADTASITGASLSDTGRVMNNVTTLNNAYNDSLQVLAQRGLPIYTWLAEEMGVTTDAVKDLAKEGKISAAVFQRAIAKNISGAALDAGDTVQGSFDNMVTAVTRLGAAFLEPSFGRGPGLIANITERIDALAPTVRNLGVDVDDAIFNKLIPGLQRGYEAAKPWVEMQWKSGLGLALREAGQEIQETIPAIRDGISAIFGGGGTAGVSTLGFVTAGVQAFTATLNALNGPLTATTGFLKEHSEIIKIVVGAYLTLKFAKLAMGGLTAGWAAATAASGNMFTRMRAGMAATDQSANRLNRSVQGIFTSVGGAAGAVSRFSGNAATANTSIAAIGRSSNVTATSLNRIGQNLNAWSGAPASSLSGMISRVQSAQNSTRTLGERFRSAGGNAVRAGGQFAKAIGGTLGVTAAVVGVGMLAQSWSDARANSQRYAASLKDVKQAQASAFDALIASRGESTPDVAAATTEQVKSMRDAMNSVKGPAWHQRLGDFFTPSGEDSFSWSNIPGLGSDMPEELSVPSQMAKNKEDNQRALQIMDALKISNEAMGQAISGTSLQWQTMRDRMIAAGEGGQYLLSKMAPLRVEHEASAEAARQLAPGTLELGRAIDVMGDNSASASTKLKALREAMDAANPTADRASGMAAYGETIRKVRGEFGSLSNVVIRADGSLDTVNESGAKLHATLRDLAEGSAQAAVSGNLEDMGRVAKENEQIFRELAAATNLPIEKIRELYGTFGGKTVDIVMKMSGQPEVVGQLGVVQKMLEGVAIDKFVTLGADQVTKDTEVALNNLGIKVDRLADPSGKTVRVQAETQAAENALAAVTSKIVAFNEANPTAQVDLNTSRFMIAQGEATDALKRLKAMDATPAPVDLIIDKLLSGKQLAAHEVAVLGAMTAVPGADMDTKLILEKIKVLNTQLDHVARRRQAFIDIQTRWSSGDQVGRGVLRPEYNPNLGGTLPTNENGSITLDHFANGGFKRINKPGKAGLFQGRGMGTVFAESKTKGEAYIPLAPEKRGRSSQILGTVAKAFGYQLLKNGQQKVDLTKGNPPASTFAGSYVNGLKVYADGGISIEDFDRLARGEIHGNQPLTGAPYQWGGVHWGDCSGAMSAFSNLAAGLPPWGSRWATGSAEGELKRRGFIMGRGTNGDLQFGWHNNGVGHTAGTLPSGANVEMGGANDGGMYNGSVGANDGQFTNHAYMPGDQFGGGFDWDSGPEGEAKGGYVIRPDGSFYYDPNMKTDSSGNIVGPFDSRGGETDSISGLFGAAASAAVAGQVSDILGVFGIPDQPSQLAAYNEYIDARKGYLSGMLEKLNKDEREKNGGGDGTGSKLEDGSASPLERAELKDKKDQLKREFDDAKFERSMKYDEAKDMLADKYRPKGSDKNAYRRELDELEDRYKREEFDKKREYDDAVDALENGLRDRYIRNDQPSTQPESETGAQQSAPQEQVINYNPTAGAGQWAPYVARVLTMLGLDQSLGDKVIAQIDIESKGDPRAVNEGYTAGGGHPSGLLQTLPNTFNAFKSGQLSSDIFDPMANIYAGCNYANNDPKYKDRGIAGIWPTTAGYASGGLVKGKGTGTSDEIPLWASNGEFVVDAATTKAAGALLPHLNGNPQLASAVSNLVMGAGNIAKQYSPQIGIAGGVASAVGSMAGSLADGVNRQIQTTAGQFKHNAPGVSTIDNRVVIESMSAKDADDIARKIARSQRVRAMTYSGRP